MTHTAGQYDHAVLAGIRLFQARGFENVSIEDVVLNTGLNRYSIYTAFGTKGDFFEECVKKYCSTALASLERLAGDEALDPREAARANLYAAAQDMSELNAGCLVCSNMDAMLQEAPALADYCSAYFESKEQLVKQIFGRARDLGMIAAEVDPALAAKAFMTFKFGLSHRVKLAPSYDELKQIIDTYIAAAFRN